MSELQRECDEVNSEIKHRDVKFMNQYTIDRSIELHFLLKAGVNYLDNCTTVANEYEEEKVDEYEKEEFEEFIKDKYNK